MLEKNSQAKLQLVFVLVKNDSVRMTENSKRVFGCRNARFMKQFARPRRSYKPVNLAHLNLK